MHAVVAGQQVSYERSRSGRCPAIAATFARRVWACVAARRLDARLAAGEDPLGDGVLACRSRRLISARSRRRLASGLEHAWSTPRSDVVLSAAVAVDDDAVEVARPALQQLALALRSGAVVEARGVAITRILLTEPCSALYRPAYRDELYELACMALLALGSRQATGTARLRR